MHSTTNESTGNLSVEYPSPSIKKTGTIDQASLTSHNPEPHVRRSPSESIKLAAPPFIYHFSNVSVSGWLPIILACQSDRGLAEARVVQYVCAHVRQARATSRAPSIRVHTLATPLITYCTSFVSFSGCLLIF
uniref:Uncharacterized protein n=1 Tax=Mesocestoides corti TaxID=53468 RepID=A0A5K3FZL3_MESCO